LKRFPKEQKKAKSDRAQNEKRLEYLIDILSIFGELILIPFRILLHGIFLIIRFIVNFIF